VQELSGGRLLLGLGAGPPGPGALQRVRDAVRSLRADFAGRPADDGFVLALAMERPPPIWLAALGDRMVRLAGEIADGVLLNWCTPARVERARELLEEGARAAGRAPDEVVVGVYLRACLDHEDEVALEALREPAGQYASMPHYRRQMDDMGLGELANAAAEATGRGALADVPERLVRELCLLGDPEAAVLRVQAYRAAGADLPIIYPVPAREPVSSIMGTLLALAPQPAIQP
jgi:alkanesulfonate monooxygenase SsuD/methylene tetrahydromethanopterin reductase-like flavin-dependent oxidoreductase (luciferase family)